MERLGCEEDFQEWMVRGDCRVVAFDAERSCPCIPGSDALKTVNAFSMSLFAIVESPSCSLVKVRDLCLPRRLRAEDAVEAFAIVKEDQQP